MAENGLTGKISNGASQNIKGANVKSGSQKGGVVKKGGDLRNG